MQELKTVLEKLVKFIGKNVKSLVEREDEAYCFRLHKNRVYYVSERLMKKATNVRFDDSERRSGAVCCGTRQNGISACR